MPSFRILTLEELELLKPEFVQFLVANGISGQEWDKWRIDNPDKRQEWVGRFSDYVFFSIIQKTKFWEKQFDDGFQLVQVLEDTFRLLSFKNNASNADQTENGPQNIEAYTGIKKIVGIYKNEEVQKLFDQGFIPVIATQNVEMSELFEKYFIETISEPSQN